MKATPVVVESTEAPSHPAEKPVNQPLPAITVAAEPKKTCCGGCDKNAGAPRSGCGGKG